MSKILGVHTPSKIQNMVINGALDFWQEKAGNTSTVNTATTVSQWSADMFAYVSSGSTVKNYSLVRSTDVPSVSQCGFSAPYSVQYTQLGAIASPAAADYIEPIQYRMEGKDYAGIHGNVATFEFWFKGSVSGTYSFAIRNVTGTRSYVTTFQGSNTWTFNTITVPLDTVGIWPFDTGLSMYVDIGSYSGSNFTTSTLNSWQAGNYFTASTATNYQATVGATLQVALLSIVKGPLGLGPKGFQRNAGTIEEELAACQRYYEKSYNTDVSIGTINADGLIRTYMQTANNAQSTPRWKVEKRVAPIFTPYSFATGAAGVIRNSSTATDVGLIGYASSTTGYPYLDVSTPQTTGNDIRYHYVADARL